MMLIRDIMSRIERIWQAVMRNLQGKDTTSLTAFRAEVLELRKYAVLNSTAAIKAVKKRNRHVRVTIGESAKLMRATDLLSQQHFFTSSKLASLSTQAEILAKVQSFKVFEAASSLQNALNHDATLQISGQSQHYVISAANGQDSNCPASP